MPGGVGRWLQAMGFTSWRMCGFTILVRSLLKRGLVKHLKSQFLKVRELLNRREAVSGGKA
jgi:hypothetical protein